MITISERVGIMSALTEKAMILKESAGHDIMIEWSPILNEIKIRAYIGYFKYDKDHQNFYINLGEKNPAERFHEVMEYLNNMGKTSESEAQNMIKQEAENVRR